MRLLEIAAVGVGIGRDERPEALLMLDPARGDLGRHLMVVERLAHDLNAPREMAAEDRMWAVRVAKRAPRIALLSAREMRRRELSLKAFDAIAIRVPEEEADHDIVKDSIDKIVQDPREPLSPAYRFEIIHILIVYREAGDGEPHLL